MLPTILTLVLILVFAIICVQDLKYRAIHAILLVITGIIAIIYNFLEPQLLIYDMLQSIGFLLVTSVAFMIYQTIVKKQLQNPIDSSIGLGDILFFIVITPLFQLHNYMLFFIVGLLLSVVMFLLTHKTRKHTTIPLAGYLSICLIICFGLKICNIVNPFFIEF